MGNLIRNNVLAFIKKEPVYFFTMTLIASIMFAFNSMLFSPARGSPCWGYLRERNRICRRNGGSSEKISPISGTFPLSPMWWGDI